MSLNREIKSLADAKQTWADLSEKYNKLLPSVRDTKKKPEEKKVAPSKKTPPTKNQAALLIQDRWNFLRRSDRPVTVILGKKHSPEIHYVLNYEKNAGKIKKTLNKQKLQAMDTFLKTLNWDNPILYDKHFGDVVISFYVSGKISLHQFSTLLERFQTLKDFKFAGLHELIDEKQNFVTATKDFIMEVCINKFTIRFRRLGFASQQQLKYLVAALPRSEHFFYSTEIGRYPTIKTKNTEFLGEVLNNLNALYVVGSYIIHFSAGMREALSIVRFGVDQHARSFPRLGNLSMRDIELAVKRDHRPRATPYSRTPYNKVIHGWKNAIDLEHAGHDENHANILSYIPRNIRNCFFRFVDVTRAAFKFEFSKEIWEWIDCDYRFISDEVAKHNKYYGYGTDKPYSSEMKNTQQMTELFCHLLTDGDSTEHAYNQHAFLIRNNKITLAGLTILLDMAINRDEWLRLRIDPDHLIAPYRKYYLEIKQHYSALCNPDIKLTLFNFHCYFNLKLKIEALLSLASIADQLNISVVKTDENFLTLTLNGNPVLENEYFEDQLMRYFDTLRLPHHKRAIFTLHYNPTEMMRYMQARNQNKTEEKSQYLAHPTTANWFLLHPFRNAFCTVTVLPIICLLINRSSCCNTNDSLCHYDSNGLLKKPTTLIEVKSTHSSAPGLLLT